MSLSKNLNELQWKQLQHDKLYHADIWVLPVQQRLKHMVLHLAKYSARLSVSALSVKSTSGISDYEAVLKDIFIISISSINILNKSLSSIVIDNWGCPDEIDTNELYKHIPKKELNNSDVISIALFCSKNSAELCKAIEATDHFEEFNSRSVILTALTEFIRLSFLVLGEDIEKKIENRLYEVEKRNIYFEKLGNYKEGYKCSGVGIS